MKVLVVDDEHDVALLLRQKFRREIRSGAVELDFAFSGDEALDYLKHHRADVVMVLSDINMPGMNGLELLRHIKALQPDLPVFMITAYGNEEFRRQAEAFGCDDYLTKPVDFDRLKERIQELVSHG